MSKKKKKNAAKSHGTNMYQNYGMLRIVANATIKKKKIERRQIETASSLPAGKRSPAVFLAPTNFVQRTLTVRRLGGRH